MAEQNIANEMLSALMCDDDHVAEISIDDQKKYLLRNAELLNTEEKKILGGILVEHNKRSALNYCNEGTIINLDMLPEHVIRHMYNFIMHKINK